MQLKLYTPAPKSPALDTVGEFTEKPAHELARLRERALRLVLAVALRGREMHPLRAPFGMVAIEPIALRADPAHGTDGKGIFGERVGESRSRFIVGTRHKAKQGMVSRGLAHGGA